MTEQWILAIACLVLATIPVLHHRRMMLFNPASFVLLAVIWSIVLKLSYITFFYSEPPGTTITPLFVHETDTGFLASGLYAMLAALAAYCLGYLASNWKSGSLVTDRAEDFGFDPRAALGLLSVGLLVVIASFVAYVFMSGNHPFVSPFSAKRFLPSLLDVESRFAYPPYYAFKVSTLIFQISLVAAALATAVKANRGLLSFSLLTYIFALFLAHFANMRLVLVILIAQLVMIATFFSRKYRFQVAFVILLLGAGTLFSITYLHRGISPFVTDSWWSRVIPGSTQSAQPKSQLAVKAPEDPVEVISPTHPGDAPKGVAISPPAPPERSPSATDVPRIKEPIAPAVQPSRRVDPANRLLQRFLYKTFAGRYFFDVVKMGIIVEGFPHKLPFLHGVSFVNAPLWPIERPELADGIGAVDVGPWISDNLFFLRRGSIATGFAADLFINFGYIGTILGFLLLGSFHRRLFEHLVSPRSSLVKIVCLLAVVPHTTLVLLNTGFQPAVIRGLFDVLAILGVWYAIRSFSRLRGTA